MLTAPAAGRAGKFMFVLIPGDEALAIFQEKYGERGSGSKIRSSILIRESQKATSVYIVAKNKCDGIIAKSKTLKNISLSYT